MSDLIDEYKKSGLVSSHKYYESMVCGDCIYFTGEECEGQLNEGNEKYHDSTACEEFEKESTP